MSHCVVALLRKKKCLKWPPPKLTTGQVSFSSIRRQTILEPRCCCSKCSIAKRSNQSKWLIDWSIALIQGRTSSGDVPSPYVKLYLLPDPQKQTKRKTNIAHSTCHPTYNEMVWPNSTRCDVTLITILTLLSRTHWASTWYRTSALYLWREGQHFILICLSNKQVHKNAYIWCLEKELVTCRLHQPWLNHCLFLTKG